VYVIAEIGCNHMGDMVIAKEMIDVAAKYCKVNAVKFQKRNPKTCLTEEQYNAPHPVPQNSYGNTYGEHRERLEFTSEQHEELVKYCRQAGIDYGVSVWDVESLYDMLAIEPDFIKIPSAKNNDQELMMLAFNLVKQPLHVSMGMTSKYEEIEIYQRVRQRTDDTIIYACTSGYPVAFEDVCLGEIKRLQARFKGIPIGYSGHHLGIAVDVAAMVLGAQYIERHFTLDRAWKGTDHAASLEPDGLRRLVRDLDHVGQALRLKPEIGFLKVEAEQRGKLKC
jgi:sialic acid synthase